MKPTPVTAACALPDYDNPYAFFNEWMKEAEEKEPSYPNAMTVVSVDRDGRPSARILLLKELDDRGFVFYTNFESRKGEELLANKDAALLFYWKSTARQVRVEGKVEAVSDTDADAYFASRPRGSQIGAWASQQSRPLDGGKPELVDAVNAMTEKFDGQDVPRPPHWSGFRLVPSRLEFWQDGEFRLHDRRQYDLQSDETWKQTVLNP